MAESDIKALERRLNRIKHNVEYPNEQTTAISEKQIDSTEDKKHVLSHVDNAAASGNIHAFTPAAPVPADSNAQETIRELREELEEYRKKLSDALGQLSELEARQNEKQQQHDVQLAVMHQIIASRAASARNEATTRVSVEQERRVTEPAAEPEKKKDSKKSLIGNIVFYSVLAVMVLAVFLFTLSNGDGVNTFMGHSAFIIKTGSMESVYPKGSLILTRTTDPMTLEVGDDITYLANPTTTVTHRIIAIYENFESSGERGFKTQGVTNASPDEKIVPSVNVVGKVIFCSVFLGSVVAFCSKNWPILLFAAVVLVALTMVLKFIFKPEKPAEPKISSDQGA